MKKFIAYISLMIYVAVTCGVSVNFHYCMNRLASVHWFAGKSDMCGRCGMETHESNHCCHDEIKVAQLLQDQVSINVAGYKIPSLDAIVSIPSDFIVASFQHIDVQQHFQNHSPPLLSAQDTYLQNNVFRI